MTELELHIDEANHCFVIKGNVGIIKANRRANYFLFNSLNARDSEEGTIIIPFRENERASLLKDIHDSLASYDLIPKDSEEVKNVLSDYFIEKEKFEAFTQKAYGIWHNQVELDDFREFKDSLKINLPNRMLYDKQLLAAFHLAFSQNACNFSVPGAGKTSVVYGAYAYLKNLPPDHPRHVNKLMIIGPLSSFGPWEDEYEECFGETVNSKRLSGGVSKEERDKHLLSVDPVESLPELTLMSYQSISFNLDNLSHFLQRNDCKFMLVLDEAHKIKNVDLGVWASSVLSLSRLSSVNSRVVLTGTPVPNGYEDIYNLYDFIWPDRDIIDFTVFQLKQMSENQYDPRIQQLIENISPFFIRIRKKDILPPEKFPVIEDKPLMIEMEADQRRIYDFIETNYMDYFQEQYGEPTFTAQLIKARFIRLMQAATNPNLLKSSIDRYFAEEGISNDLYIDDSEVIDRILNYDKSIVPQKYIAVKELLLSILAQGKKAIVWGTFIENIKTLRSYLEDNGITTQVLIGEVPVETEETAPDVITREKIIREFHNPDSSFKVIIANPFAVAESISLHKVCHHAIYFERTFNAANFIQSKDRIHRVGLDENTSTTYHYILSSDSIDNTIHRRLIEKEKRMIGLIESKEIPLISENLNYDIDFQDDLKAMIRDYVGRTDND